MFRAGDMNRGVSLVRHASYPATGTLSTPSILPHRASKRGRFLAALLAALHHSRQRQTERVLRQYQHLIARAEEREARELKSKIESLADVGE
jgi:hypothetical protein